MKKVLSLLVSAAMLLCLVAVPASAAKIGTRHDGAEHDPVNFYLTDVDMTSVTSIEDGGDGGDKKYMYIGVSEGSGMYAAHYLVDYPEEFIAISAETSTWSGGIISQINATWDDDEAWSDKFASVTNTTYEGQTGGVPMGEAGNIYINGGTYLNSFEFWGVQMGGVFHRYTLKLLKTPYQSECMQDENGYYLPMPLDMVEFEFTIPNPNSGVPMASDNYCDPEYADWFSSTDAKIYVTPLEDPSNTHVVTFYDFEGNVIAEIEVDDGEAVEAPEVPETVTVDGVTYVFYGWDGEFGAVTEDVEIRPVYYMMMDVDMDGSLTAADALLALRYSLGLAELSDFQVGLADVAADGQITALDAVTILRTVLGLI